MGEKKIITYNPNLKNLAKHLRNNSTLAEVLLWKELKGKKVLGYRFHRQKPIGKYVVDFYCPELNLVIEIDGISHNLKIGKDEVRQEEIEKLGFKFLRVLDRDVKQNLNGVIDYIKDWIKNSK